MENPPFALILLDIFINHLYDYLTDKLAVIAYKCDAIHRFYQFLGPASNIWSWLAAIPTSRKDALNLAVRSMWAFCSLTWLWSWVCEKVIYVKRGLIFERVSEYYPSRLKTSENTHRHVKFPIFWSKKTFFDFGLVQLRRTSCNVRLKLPPLCPLLAQCAAKRNTNCMLERIKGKWTI